MKSLSFVALLMLATAAFGQTTSVTQYGAKCNGVTDDTAAFSAAWAAINTTGGELDLPAGTCYIPNGWKLNQLAPNSNTIRIIRGHGKHTSRILTHNAPIGIELGGTVGIILEDFSLYDNGTAGGGAQVGVARYRTDWTQGYAGQCGGQSFQRMDITGAWSIAGVFSVGCEVNTFYDVSVHAVGPGAGYYVNSYNGIGLTANTLPINTTGASNTVNHWFGGAILAYGTGPAVYFGNGTADDVSFNGTYFDASTVADIQFGGMYGGTPNDEILGTKSFHSVRFENGVSDCIGISASGISPSLTIDSGSTFGCAGKDIHQTNTWWAGGSSGLVGADIHGVSVTGNGIVIGDTLNSTISVPGDSITILNNSYISDDRLEAKSFIFPSNYVINGTVWVQNDNAAASGGMKTYYGPDSVYKGGAGSVVVMQPFSTPPTNPVNGELATADGINWKPQGISTQTLVQWNASTGQWQVVGKQ